MPMDYRVAKVFSNNAVLAQDSAGNQAVLMSKGIGFGKRSGEIIQNCGDDQKIFYIHDGNVSASKIKQLSCDAEKVEQVTREIVEIAKERLQIENDNLYDALVDHITFAIECLHMGLPIDNPFCSEIAILYSREYETAQIAAEIIKERINVEIGDAETSFIALHLYSARKKKHIRAAMKNTRVYSQILRMVCRSVGRKQNMHSPEKSFLLNVYCLVTMTANNNSIVMNLKQQVKLNMADSYVTALKVAKLIEEEMGIQLSEDSVAFIAADIERLRQM
jgi:transcriptional antiterminator